MFNRMRMVVPAVLLATTVFGGFALTRGRAAAVNKVVPAPAVDETPAASGSETLTLAGGCFWGVQGVFQHVKGVEQAVSGYDGGSAKTADYETVSTGTTGHAEVRAHHLRSARDYLWAVVADLLLGGDRSNPGQ